MPYTFAFILNYLTISIIISIFSTLYRIQRIFLTKPRRRGKLYMLVLTFSQPLELWTESCGSVLESILVRGGRKVENVKITQNCNDLRDLHKQSQAIPGQVSSTSEVILIWPWRKERVHQEIEKPQISLLFSYSYQSLKTKLDKFMKFMSSGILVRKYKPMCSAQTGDKPYNLTIIFLVVSRQSYVLVKL